VDIFLLRLQSRAVVPPKLLIGICQVEQPFDKADYPGDYRNDLPPAIWLFVLIPSFTKLYHQLQESPRVETPARKEAALESLGRLQGGWGGN
jgi:hypothetical protein